MIDPIIFSISIGNITFSFYWYGFLVMLGVGVAAWMTALAVKKQGENPDLVWDSLLWVLPAGAVGARLWYVLNVTLGGNLRFIEEPMTIFKIQQGGLHYFGAILLGLLALYFYAKHKQLDVWLALDAVSPGLLLGQAIARPANFINQELYGQPTKLPWGIKIEAQHRIAPWNNMALFPEGTTRFHPTFAYEILWNLVAAGVLFYLMRKYKDMLKPGIIFAVWLILAGVGRQVIEFFRPDQPVFPGTGFSYSRLVAVLMIIAGALLILIKYRLLEIPHINPGRETYRLTTHSEVQTSEIKQVHSEGDPGSVAVESENNR